MSQRPPIESICAALGCTSATFLSIYGNENFSNYFLVNNASNIIEQSREHLRAADQRCRLDILLSAMLAHAPHENGMRYVAVALQIAYSKGAAAAVVDAARSWMDFLILPMLTVTVRAVLKDELAGNWVPTYLDQGSLGEKVAIREDYKCATTGTVDKYRAENLRKRGLRPPAGNRHLMTAAHIIPVALADFVGNPTELVPAAAAHMWNIFICWTGLDVDRLSGSNINSPENAILMTVDEHNSFAKLCIYFDKDAYPTAPNKYEVRMAMDIVELDDGRTSAEVEFHTRDGVQPPDPQYLAVHAAFAKVVHACGAAKYVETLEKGVELQNEVDYTSILMSRLYV